MAFSFITRTQGSALLASHHETVISMMIAGTWGLLWIGKWLTGWRECLSGPKSTTFRVWFKEGVRQGRKTKNGKLIYTPLN